MSLDDLQRESHEIMAQAWYEHQPCALLALYSGGHDSVVACMMANARKETVTVHLDTGTGIPENAAHVRKTALENHWDFYVEGPPDYKDSYENMVLTYGFPGPSSHRFCYIRLKERLLRRFIKGHVPSKGTVMIVTGVRSKESARRMGYTQPIFKQGRWLWVAPLFSWSALDISAFLDEEGIERNPVVDLLHRSGECNCGAYAHPGEFREIQTWFPEKASEIERLEKKAKDKGLPFEWGRTPPPKGQRYIPFEPMCVGCGERK